MEQFAEDLQSQNNSLSLLNNSMREQLIWIGIGGKVDKMRID